MKINKQIQEQINTLANMSDDDIDYSDIPDSSNCKYTRMDNKQFNQFIRSDLLLDDFIKASISI